MLTLFTPLSEGDWIVQNGANSAVSTPPYLSYVRQHRSSGGTSGDSDCRWDGHQDD